MIIEKFPEMWVLMVVILFGWTSKGSIEKVNAGEPKIRFKAGSKKGNYLCDTKPGHQLKLFFKGQELLRKNEFEGHLCEVLDVWKEWAECIKSTSFEGKTKFAKEIVRRYSEVFDLKTLQKRFKVFASETLHENEIRPMILQIINVIPLYENEFKKIFFTGSAIKLRRRNCGTIFTNPVSILRNQKAN